MSISEKYVSFIPVLAPRDAVEIDYNFQTIVPRPTDSLKEIFVLPLDIRLAGSNLVGPIPYWDAHVIESKVGIDSTMFSNGATRQRRTQLLRSAQSRPR